MLFFSHLFAGCIIGLVIGSLIGDLRVVPFSSLGAVLPDLIDKPVGHIILHQTLDDGRIYFHTLLAVVVIAIIGILLWRRYGSPVVCFLPPAVLAHQLTDAMWRMPVNWFYPFFGEFVQKYYPEYFSSMILAHLTSCSEWIFFLALMSMLWRYVRRHATGGTTGNLHSHTGILLIVAGTFFIVGGFAGTTFPFLLSQNPADNLIFGIIALSGGIVLRDERFNAPFNRPLFTPGKRVWRVYRIRCERR